MMKQISIATLFAIAVALALAERASAAIIYNTPGSTYSQGFNTLPITPQNASLGASPAGWTDDNGAPGAGNFSIVGWYLYHPTLQAEGGFNGHQRIRIGAGTANTGAGMSFGAAANTERSLGMVNSNTLADLGATDGNAFYGFRVTNTTGGTLGSFTLTYDGEQWRDGGAAVPVSQNITVSYKLAAASIQDTGYTAVPAATFTSPVFANTGGGAAVDGNGAGRVNDITATVTGLTWLNGTDLWIRWTDLNNAGNDHGLGIDDVEFSALLANVAPTVVDYDEPLFINASVPGSYSHQMTATDPDLPPQTLTWSTTVTLQSYTPDFGGTLGLANMPTMDADGTFDWDTVGSGRGHYVFNVSVDDGAGGSDTGTITLHVNAVPEPASLMMLVVALAGGCLVRKRA